MDNRFRILSIIGNFVFGGAENRLLALSCNIDRNRFDHTVLTIEPVDFRNEQACAMLRQYKDAGVEVLQLPNYDCGKVARLARRTYKICEIVEERGIDLVDAHCETASLLATLAGMITGRRRTATLYHPHPLYPPRFWRAAEQFILMNIDLIITDSALRASEIESNALFKRPDVIVLPNGIRPPERSLRPEAIRQYLRLPDDPDVRIVGQISALREFKGQMVLLEAAQKVLRTDSSVFFLLVGYEASEEPDFKQRLERRAAELGISDRIRIVGYPGPIGDIWSVIDLQVHASLFDSLPNAIIEGMSLGKPAVVTAVGGVPDAVTHGETGLVIPPADPTALASAILQLLRDPVLGKRFGDAAMSRYQQRYRVDLIARKLESSLVGVINGCSVRPLWNNSATERSL